MMADTAEMDLDKVMKLVECWAEEVPTLNEEMELTLGESTH